MAVFSLIFVADTKIVSGYNFVARLTKCYSIELSINWIILSIFYLLHFL